MMLYEAVEERLLGTGDGYVSPTDHPGVVSIQELLLASGFDEEWPDLYPCVNYNQMKMPLISAALRAIGRRDGDMP